MRIGQSILGCEEFRAALVAIVSTMDVSFAGKLRNGYARIIRGQLKIRSAVAGVLRRKAAPLN